MKTEGGFERPRIEPEQIEYPPEPDFYMPAMPPLRLIALLEFWWKRWRDRRQFCRLYEPMLMESDAQLKDVGLSREDIAWAMNLPLRFDAHKALRECRAMRVQAITIPQ